MIEKVPKIIDKMQPLIGPIKTRSLGRGRGDVLCCEEVRARRQWPKRFFYNGWGLMVTGGRVGAQWLWHFILYYNPVIIIHHQICFRTRTCYLFPFTLLLIHWTLIPRRRYIVLGPKTDLSDHLRSCVFFSFPACCGRIDSNPFSRFIAAIHRTYRLFCVRLNGKLYSQKCET